MKLRIRQHEYVNQGTINPTLKDKTEFHVTVKWNTQREADEFVAFIKTVEFFKPIKIPELIKKKPLDTVKKPIKKKYVKKSKTNRT